MARAQQLVLVLKLVADVAGALACPQTSPLALLEGALSSCSSTAALSNLSSPCRFCLPQVLTRLPNVPTAAVLLKGSSRGNMSTL